MPDKLCPRSEGSIQESRSLQWRSQAPPGDRARDEHTYNIARAGTEGPRLGRDTSPGPLAGDGEGGGPRGGRSQRWRPMSTPRTLTEVDLHYSYALL